MNNYDGRYTYWRKDLYWKTTIRSGTILIRDDGFRIAFIRETRPEGFPLQDGLDTHWTHFVEYKQCEFPGVASELIINMLHSLAPADMGTIASNLLES